jgi:NAD-dependent SIR2 family protein deacetylase
MERKCISCGELIHPKRIEIIPNTKTCVKCSSTGIKKGITVLKGDVNKDDTWNDIVFVDDNQYKQYISSKKLPPQQDK